MLRQWCFVIGLLFVLASACQSVSKHEVALRHPASDSLQCGGSPKISLSVVVFVLDVANQQ